MRTRLPACLAIILSATAATAQGPGKAAAYRATCPLTVDLTYTKVGKLDFGTPDPKLDIAGWQPRFAPASVRLTSAMIAYGADDKRDIIGFPPDNADSAKPGEPLVYAIHPSDPKNPASASHVTCEYEGGFALQQALPPTIRTCSVRTQSRKAAPIETTTREFLTAAEVSCR